MSLLLPLFLGGIGLIGLPVLLHLLRRKPTVTIVFPSLQFLGATAVLETRRHRLRRWLTLLLRCLIILLICLAFSRPFWSSANSGHGRAVVIAIDNSFSLQTKGRWEKLREWAGAQLAPLGTGDQAGLLLMNPAPHWLVPLSDKVDLARATLAAQSPGFETTRYDAALRLAGEALTHCGAENLSLVWMADEQQLGWLSVSFSTPLPGGVKFLVPPPVDPPARQAAILKTSWSNADGGLVLHVELRGYVPAQDTRQLTVRANGKILAKQSVTLTAGQPTSVDVPLTGLPADKAQGVQVQLDPDDLAADDTFYAVHEPNSGTKIYVTPAAAGDFDFLRHAVDATRSVEAAPLQSHELPEGEWPVNSVVLVRGDAPFQPPLVSRLEAYLQAGGSAWFFLDGSPAQTAWMQQRHLELKAVKADADAPLHLRNWDAAHPALEPLAESSLLGLLDLEFYQGVSLSGLAATPLATWDNGEAAIAEVSTGGQQFFACGFAPQKSATNWTVQASFVPFVHSTLTWLMRRQNSGGDWRVGDAIALANPGTWRRLDPPATTADEAVSGFVRPTAPGLFEFTSQGQTRLYAVNLKTDESDPALWPTPDDFQTLMPSGAKPPVAVVAAATSALSREDAENHQRVWWWLLALALVLILAELRLANRTST